MEVTMGASTSDTTRLSRKSRPEADLTAPGHCRRTASSRTALTARSPRTPWASPNRVTR